jgi:hypothetical protein
MSAPRTKAVRLRPGQWQTVVACLDAWSARLKEASAIGPDGKLAAKIARSQIVEITMEIERQTAERRQDRKEPPR